MDIIHLIERLEQTLNESRRLPLTANLLIDEDRIFHIIDQMRTTIPEEIRQAQRVMAEKDRVLAQAKEEAERIRDLARQEAMELVNRDAVVINAKKRADAIVERAHIDAEDVRQGADKYALRILTQLEQDMTRSLSVVRNGVSKLEMVIAEQTQQMEDVEDELEDDDYAERDENQNDYHLMA